MFTRHHLLFTKLQNLVNLVIFFSIKLPKNASLHKVKKQPRFRSYIAKSSHKSYFTSRIIDGCGTWGTRTPNLTVTVLHVSQLHHTSQFFSTPGRNRTYDLLLRRQLLYPLSYQCIKDTFLNLLFNNTIIAKRIFVSIFKITTTYL